MIPGFDWILPILSPIVIVFIGLALGGGILLGRRLEPEPGNQVNFLQPKTRSGWDLDVIEESALVLETEQVKGFPLKRFLKFYDGYDIRKRKRVFTRYLAMEGIAFTTKASASEEKTTEGEEKPESKRELNPGPIPSVPGKIMIRLHEYLKGKWGEEAWDNMDPQRRRELEDDKIGVTVRIVEPELSATMKKITEDSYWKDIEKKVPKLIAEGVEDVAKSPLIEKFAWAGVGAFLCMVAWVLGVFKI